MPTRRRTSVRRKLKRAKMGKERKRRLRKYGSTPPFPVHPEDAEADK